MAIKLSQLSHKEQEALYLLAVKGYTREAAATTTRLYSHGLEELTSKLQCPDCAHLALKYVRLGGDISELTGGDIIWYGLDHSERQIALLAALGHSSGEIAAQLHIKLKKIQCTLKEIVELFCIQSRHQLPAVLANISDPELRSKLSLQ